MPPLGLQKLMSAAVFPLLLLLAGEPVLGQMIDPSFGINGFAPVPSAGVIAYPGALGFASDGSILVAGHFDPGGNYPDDWFVAKCTPDGMPDPNFNGNGIMEMTPCTSDDWVTGLLVDANDRTYVLGYEVWYPLGMYPADGCVVARVLPNGQPDLSFGQDHAMAFYKRQELQDTRGVAMALLPGGQLNVSCWDSPGSMFRLHEDGSKDTLFGIHPYVNPTGFDASFGSGCAALDGGVYMVGAADLGTPCGAFDGQELVVLKVDSSGNPDPSFGEDGWYRNNFGYRASGGGAWADHQGRVIVCANVDTCGSAVDGIALIRLGPDGSFDESFGSNGYIPTRLRDLSISIDGRIAVLELDGRIRMFDDSGLAIQDFGNAGAFDLPSNFQTGTYYWYMSFTPDGSALIVCTRPHAGITYGFLMTRIIADISTTIADKRPVQLLLFPNPSDGNVTLQIPKGQIRRVQVNDAAGRLVIDEAAGSISRTQTLLIDGMMSGYYSICATDATGRQFRSAFVRE